MATNQGKGYGTQSILGRGGGKKMAGGAREVLPLQKGEGGKSFSRAEVGGGHKKF